MFFYICMNMRVTWAFKILCFNAVTTWRQPLIKPNTASFDRNEFNMQLKRGSQEDNCKVAAGIMFCFKCSCWNFGRTQGSFHCISAPTDLFSFPHQACAHRLRARAICTTWSFDSTYSVFLIPTYITSLTSHIYFNNLWVRLLTLTRSTLPTLNLNLQTRFTL